MPSDELGWRHYSGFAPCIITQTNVLGRPGGGYAVLCYYFVSRLSPLPDAVFSQADE